MLSEKGLGCACRSCSLDVPGSRLAGLGDCKKGQKHDRKCDMSPSFVLDAVNKMPLPAQQFASTIAAACSITKGYCPISNVFDLIAHLQRTFTHRRMHEELKAVGDSPRLAGLIAQMVGKSLRMLAEKAEYMSAGGMPPSCAKILVACRWEAQLWSVGVQIAWEMSAFMVLAGACLVHPWYSPC